MTDEDLATIEYLSKAWGGVKPLDGTSVVSHALRLAIQNLTQAERKKTKKTG